MLRVRIRVTPRVSCFVLQARLSLSLVFGLQLISRALRVKSFFFSSHSAFTLPSCLCLCLSVISIKRAKLSYDDKCRSSNGNQLLNEKDR